MPACCKALLSFQSWFSWARVLQVSQSLTSFLHHNQLSWTWLYLTDVATLEQSCRHTQPWSAWRQWEVVWVWPSRPSSHLPKRGATSLSQSRGNWAWVQCYSAVSRPSRATQPFRTSLSARVLDCISNKPLRWLSGGKVGVREGEGFRKLSWHACCSLGMSYMIL